MKGAPGAARVSTARVVRTAQGVVMLPVDLLSYRRSSSRRRPIFVVGCGNSGTSLVRVILGAHERVHAFHLETGFVASQAPSRLGRLFEILRKRPLMTARQLSVEAVQRGADVWCEKTPRHVHSIDILLAIDPLARVVLVTRNPHDVVASFIRRGYSFDRALNRWIEDSTAGLRALMAHDRVIGLRYEDLVERPGPSVESLCDALSLKYSETLLNYASRPQKLETPSNQTRPDMAAHWRHREAQLNRPIVDNRNTWSQTLTDHQAELVAARTREIDDELRLAINHRLKVVTPQQHRTWSVRGR